MESLNDQMLEYKNQFGESPLFKAAKNNLKHSACPVPTALMKAIEVSCGLALPRDVTIRVEK